MSHHLDSEPPFNSPVPAPLRDEHGRMTPGVLPGWGMSWWWHEQALTPAHIAAMTPEQRVGWLVRYWRAVARGWLPPMPPTRWSPYHPFDGQGRGGDVAEDRGGPPTASS